MWETVVSISISIHLKLLGFRILARKTVVLFFAQIPGTLVKPFEGLVADDVGRGRVVGPYKMAMEPHQ